MHHDTSPWAGSSASQPVPPLSLRSGVRRRRCDGPALVDLAVPDTATAHAEPATKWVWETGFRTLSREIVCGGSMRLYVAEMAHLIPGLQSGATSRPKRCGRSPPRDRAGLGRAAARSCRRLVRDQLGAAAARRRDRLPAQVRRARTAHEPGGGEGGAARYPPHHRLGQAGQGAGDRGPDRPDARPLLRQHDRQAGPRTALRSGFLTSAAESGASIWKLLK